MKKKFIYNLLVTLIISSCSLKNNNYGIELNENRLKDSLPLLPKRWLLSTRFGSTFFWKNSINSDSLIYKSKEVRVENNKVVYEENRFLGINKYELTDGFFREELWVSKEYNLKSESNIKYHYNGIGCESGKDLTTTEAILILKKWGLDKYFKIDSLQP